MKSVLGESPICTEVLGKSLLCGEAAGKSPAQAFPELLDKALSLFERSRLLG